MQNQLGRSDRQRWMEIIAVIITGLGKFVFMDVLNWRLFYILSAIVFWTIYVFCQYQKNPEILKYWGFTRSNFKACFYFLFPFGLLSLCAFFIIGNWKDTNILNWHILPLLILYPVWGTIQQFIIVALIAGNLKDMQHFKMSNGWIIISTAFLFSVVHFPFQLLVVGTFFLALLYTYLYLKMKNLYVLGLYHGWLGAFFFYTVLERDPYLEVFSFLN